MNVEEASRVRVPVNPVVQPSEENYLSMLPVPASVSLTIPESNATNTQEINTENNPIYNFYSDETTVNQTADSYI